jgi:chemosensory pili system protein ChpA (sensor histidine kinase/response regulator)
MASFSIDEVRDSFRADMSQFLAEIDAAAGAMESSLSTLPAFPEDAHERPLFEAIAARAHAVAGTGSLVGAVSLSASGKRLENLTRHGRVALFRARAQLARASEIARLCGAGARAMQEMLELELDHRRDEADAAARAFEEQIAPLPPAEELRTDELKLLEEVSSEPQAEPPAAPAADSGLLEAAAPPPPPQAAPREFSFEEDDPGAAEALDEIKAIFQQELREALPILKQNLVALDQRPEDLAAAEQLERLYHTLKGASATVGLTEVSQLAASLQHRVEEAIESGASVPRGLLGDLVKGTERLFDLSGAGEQSFASLSSEAAAASATGGGAPARDLFAREAQGVVEEASRMAAELPAAPPEEALRIQAELAKLFHRLKGSSLVVGEIAAANAAAWLQNLCESGGAVRRAELAAGLEELAAQVDPPARKPAEEAPPPAPAREACSVEQDPDLWEAFCQECAELMENIQRDALALEESAQPQELLQSLMRQHHTLKGAANSVGIAPTGRLLHRIEDLLEALLEAPILPPMKEVASLLLEGQSEVRRHLATARQGFVQSTQARMEARIRRVLAGGRAGPPAGGSSAAPSSAARVPPSAQEPAAAESHGPGSRGSAAADEGIGQKRFIRVNADQLDSLMNLAGELVVNRSRLSSRVTSLRAMRQGLSRSQRRLLECVEDFVGKHEFANLDGRALAARRGQAAEAPSLNGFGALELDRYDDVHILSRSLAEVSDDLGEVFGQLFREMGEIAEDAESFGGIISGIQREVTRARMVPVEDVFTRLRLPVRDAAAREGKEVRVAVSGEEVHLDKTIADALFQPMLHLVRNAVFHGVEVASARQAAGKDRVGTIHLGARQESGQIVLQVADDGRGLDLAGLHARGLAMGLLPAETPVSDPAVKDLVFAPGLSTASATGMVSGRGVGGDIVRKAIERLNGTIRVETTAGAGTAFTITLPLTLAITRALLVRHADRLYALPLYFAEHIFELAQAQVVESLGVRRMRLGGSFIQVRSLSELLGGAQGALAHGPVLVLRVGEQRIAAQVDAVVAQEEIVVKSLGALLSGHPVLAGVTIRGNGELVLIVDVPGIVQRILASAAPQAAAAPAGSPAQGGAPAASPAPAAEVRALVDGSKVPVPAGAERESAGAPASAPGPAPASEGGGPLRVLFVDDSVSVRKVAERALKSLGVQVAVAVDGMDALEKLRAQTFDLVFTDLEMPRMHGYELIRELRFLPAYRALPIVVVSSRSGQKHQDQARALGATDYLTKPFSAESLGAALKRWGPLRGATEGQETR